MSAKPTTGEDVSRLWATQVAQGKYESHVMDAQVHHKAHNTIASLVDLYASLLQAGHARERQLATEVQRLQVEVQRLQAEQTRRTK